MSVKELDRLGRHFGRLLPDNVLTPAEVQRFCMNRRGAARKAIADLPQYLQEKRSGKSEFEYDIHRTPPQSGPEEDFANTEDFSEDESSSQSTSSVQKDDVNKQQLNELPNQGTLGKHITTVSLQVKDDEPLLLPALSAQQLHLADGRNDRYDTKFDDDLAYGEFN